MGAIPKGPRKRKQAEMARRAVPAAPVCLRRLRAAPLAGAALEPARPALLLGAGAGREGLSF